MPSGVVHGVRAPVAGTGGTSAKSTVAKFGIRLMICLIAARLSRGVTYATDSRSMIPKSEKPAFGNRSCSNKASSRRSVDVQLEPLDNIPVLEVVLHHECRQFFRRAGLGFEAADFYLFFVVGVVDDLVDIGVELFDDVGRRCARHQNGEPQAVFDLRQS